MQGLSSRGTDLRLMGQPLDPWCISFYITVHKHGTAVLALHEQAHYFANFIGQLHADGTLSFVAQSINSESSEHCEFQALKVEGSTVVMQIISTWHC